MRCLRDWGTEAGAPTTDPVHHDPTPFDLIMDQHINYITLGVADVGRSRRFYQEVFGWQESAESNEHIAFFQTGGALILALFQRDALAKDAGHDDPDTVPGSFPGFSMAHNLATIAEVDALFARFREHGATIVKPPQKVFWGGYSGYIADPDGFLWEIAHNPFLQKLRG